ncbi:uridine-preferring nucleoside hydrolase UriH [Ornithinicoccus halotolerans]|uniref:uridine-preferring nucleoside hydrolase UriH n=1 Tax=Ornithinicoccus halotolerans TaxID=1748220 RepID=UPI0012978791|nr:nucleoside hydrolase [Ornithinicoccus halotolerans]
MSHQVILDCDPGHDDAVAMLLALGSPSIDLLGVTTVAGNQTLAKVTRNALSVLALSGHAGAGVGVYPGCARPLVRELAVAEDIHGESGLDGVELPVPTAAPRDEHAVDFIVRTVMKRPPGTVTLVPTGPLTNIALAVRREPRLAGRVREVVLMGGGYQRGNTTAVAEFNIRTDPEAAHIVVNEDWPVTMVGLDLTHQALATPAVEREIAGIGSPVSDFVVGLLGFFRQAYQRQQGFADPPVHDPCTIAYLLDPGVLTTRRAPLDVELRGELTAGMTVADLRGPEPENCRSQVAVCLDRERFWSLVVSALRAL